MTRLAEHLRGRFQRSLRAANFGPKQWALPKPRICVMEPKRSRRTEGWHSPKRWHQGFVRLDEIVLTPWAVDKGVLYAASVLAHEFAHLANAVAQRRDTSRQDRYHNEIYRETAPGPLGDLSTVRRRTQALDGRVTELGEDLRDFVRRLAGNGTVDVHVFRYQRKPQPKAEPALVKFVADCGCKVMAYVPRKRAEETALCCGRCGAALRRAR